MTPKRLWIYILKVPAILNGELKGNTVLNYLSSWWRWSLWRQTNQNYWSRYKTFTFSGIAQVFYGDESARSLVVEGTQGDATLRSFMNWDAIKKSWDKKNTVALEKTRPIS
jgi:alpha-amylase